jgi:hypothetical protein
MVRGLGQVAAFMDALISDMIIQGLLHPAPACFFFHTTAPGLCTNSCEKCTCVRKAMHAGTILVTSFLGNILVLSYSLSQFTNFFLNGLLKITAL